MGFIDRLFGREERASLEDPRVPISSKNIVSFLGLDVMSAAGETVTIDSALGVPAIWSAVNFLSGTLAGLPLHLYSRKGDDRTRQRGGLATILHDAVNDEQSSFDWRKYIFDQVFTQGRGVTFIERSPANRVLNLWPLDSRGVTVKRNDGRKFYEYRDGSTRKVTYQASEVIDIPFMLKSDMLTHRGPILTNKDVIGLAQAVTKYGSKFFQGGGVPPFAIEGPFQSPGALQRSAEDLSEAVKKAAKEQRLALSLPAGHTIKQIGVDPEKSQLVELQRVIIEQIARIYSIPPVFLQDLTHGTFTNTEQQDLMLAKHTMKRWVEAFEQELNLKLFGRVNTRQYVEMNMDGLMRGDFKTRMEGNARAIQTGQLTPNEARAMDNRPSLDGGDRLLIQGATVPLTDAGKIVAPNPTPAGDDDNAA